MVGNFEKPHWVHWGVNEKGRLSISRMPLDSRSISEVSVDLCEAPTLRCVPQLCFKTLLASSFHLNHANKGILAWLGKKYDILRPRLHLNGDLATLLYVRVQKIRRLETIKIEGEEDNLSKGILDYLKKYRENEIDF